MTSDPQDEYLCSECGQVAHDGPCLEGDERAFKTRVDETFLRTEAERIEAKRDEFHGSGR